MTYSAPGMVHLRSMRMLMLRALRCALAVVKQLDGAPQMPNLNVRSSTNLQVHEWVSVVHYINNMWQMVAKSMDANRAK